MPKLITPPPDRPQTVLGYAAPGSRRSAPDPSGDRRPKAAPGPASARSGSGSGPGSRSGSPSGSGSGAARRRRAPNPGRRSSDGPRRGGPSPARATAASAAVAARARSRVNPVARLGHRAADAVGGLAGWLVAGGGHVRSRSGSAGGDDPSSEEDGTGPAIDPRFRARWVAARREEGQRRLRLVLVAGALLALVAAGLGALHTPWLSVRQLQITTGSHVSEAEIAQLSGLRAHPPMIDVNGAAVRRHLLAQPWVATATVSRSWPSTVRITVGERRAVAVVGPPTSPVLVDGTGRVLGPAATPAGLPQLPGAPAAPAAGGWLPGTGGPGGGTTLTGVALDVAAALPPAVASQVASVNVGPGGGVTLALTDRVTTVALGPVAPAPPGSAAAASLARQGRALAAVAASVDLRTVARIDVTVPDHPALTPVQPAATVSTTSRG